MCVCVCSVSWINHDLYNPPQMFVLYIFITQYKDAELLPFVWSLLSDNFQVKMFVL